LCLPTRGFYLYKTIIWQGDALRKGGGEKSELVG